MNDPDPRALGLWVVAAFLLVVLSHSPVLHLMVVAIAWIIASRGEEIRPFYTLLALGGIALVLRTLLFGLAAGGNDVGAVIAAAALEGTRFTAILACLGAFLCLTSSTALIRMLPRSMFEAALVLNIAMVFAPQLIRTARDLKDAGRMRGVRGAQLIRSAVMPLLATGLERSIKLAESMDSRGFGRRASELPRWMGPVTAVSAALTMSAVCLWLMGTARNLAGPGAVLGALVVLALMREMGSSSARTSYRPSTLDGSDRVVACGGIAVGVLAAVFAAAGGLDSPSLIPPVGATFITTFLVIPALVIRRPA